MSNQENQTNNLKGLSLFSGGGVAEASLDGIDILLANEIDEKRGKFYSSIYSDTKMIVGDIRNEYIKSQIVDISKELNINFLMATPPCQGMSEAGKRDLLDERNNLIIDTIDIIKKIMPDYVLIENVARMMKTIIRLDGKDILIPDYIKYELGKFYSINNDNLIKASNHGVPQMRTRYIFLMTKIDKNINWNFPNFEKEINLNGAIGNLPKVDPLLREGRDLTISKFPKFSYREEVALNISKWHRPPVHSLKQVNWMMHTPSATSAIYNEKFYPKKDDGTRIKAHHNNYRRMDWNKPARTMTQNNGVISSLCCVHPGRPYKASNGEILYSDPRVLTIYELMIVSSIPLDWRIPYWANDSFIRKIIGEGIPPLMVGKIISSLLNQL